MCSLLPCKLLSNTAVSFLCKYLKYIIAADNTIINNRKTPPITPNTTGMLDPPLELSLLEEPMDHVVVVVVVVII